MLTSEDYGHELAGWLDASHVTVDPGRRAVPISGSELRADLAGRRTRCVTEAGRDYTVVKWQQARAATAAAAGRPGPRLDEVEWTTEEGDLAIRAAMTGWFAAALTAAGHSWVLLTGSLEDRRALAARVTDYALANRGRFGPAITDIPGTSVAR